MFAEGVFPQLHFRETDLKEKNKKARIAYYRKIDTLNIF